MYRLYRSICKELLLIRRDLGGLVIIFLMPILLIITVTLIQDSTFQNVEGAKIPVVVVDEDQGEISKNVIQELTKSKSFEIITNKTEKEAEKAVFSGDYQIAIVIPKNLSKDINENIDYKVKTIVSSFGLELDSTTVEKQIAQPADIHLYFDPATNTAFKSSIRNSIDKMIFEIENKKIYQSFQEQLGTEEPLEKNENLISFKEISPVQEGKTILPNSVQHNVPAWALFAMFFIVIPLSINIVKDKTQGTNLRLVLSPTSYIIPVIGKTLTYLCICLIQFILMVLVGVYVFPHIGLDRFEINGNMFPLLVVSFFAGLAAIGFGIMIGTVAETPEQSAPLGATSVVLLAAIGGIWMPVFLMPHFMQTVAQFSPMNWGLEAYYSIILRNVSLLDVSRELLLLFIFYLITISISIIYERKRNAV